MGDAAKKNIISYLASIIIFIYFSASAFAANTSTPVWTELGAGPIEANAVNTSNGIEGMASSGNPSTGAITKVLVDPGDVNTIYAGAVNGGIWKTTNGGTSWSPLTDRQSFLSVGAMNFDITDATNKTLIAGAGRQSAYGFASGPLTGILYSSDAGSTWSEKGRTELYGKDITGVAARGAVMLATVRSIDSPISTVGLYRSSDSGVTFSNSVTGLPAGNVQNLAQDPTNSSRFYLSIVNGNDAQTGVYRSDDTGATWTLVKAVSGLSTNDEGRILLSVGAGGVLVAQVQQGKTRLDILRTANQGTSWVDMGKPSTPDFTGLFPGGQAGVHGTMIVDPTDGNIVYAAGDTQAEKSGSLPNSIGATDWTCPVFRGVFDPVKNTTTWTYITNINTLTNSAPHADARTFAIDANGRLLFGNDGGVYAYAYPSTTKKYDWFSLVGNLRVNEMTQSCWNSITHTVSAAAQDLGPYFQYSGQKGTYTWSTTNGGDGGPSPVNSVTLKASSVSVVYASTQHMGSFRRIRVGASDDATKAATTLTLLDPQLNGTSIAGNKAYMSFLPFIDLNRADPRKMAIGGKQLFIGTDDLTVDTTNGYSFAVTSILTPSSSNEISSLAYGTNTSGANVNNNALLAGAGNSSSTSSAGQLYYTSNAGTAAMSTLSGYTGKYVWKAIFDERDGNRFFAVDGSDVWRSTDAGANFAKITNDLPSNFVDRRGLAFASNNGVYALFAGGVSDDVTKSGGLYVTRYTSDTSVDSASPAWTSFGGSLANAPIYGLSYDSTDDVLLANLLGRGAWVVYDLTTYFPEASGLIFGKANNDSAPAASVLTDGTTIAGAAFGRGLTKSGTGTLTISSAGTYTGITTISAGTLQIGSGGTTGSIGAGNITNNATLAFNRSDSLAIANVISGGGALNQIGSGTTTLTGANTYTGATSVNKGTLKIDASTGSLAASALTFGGSGTFNYDNAASAGARSQGMGALTFSAGDGNVQATRTAAQDVSLTFSSLAARAAGATGNFITSGGTNGTSNKIVLTGVASGSLIDKGIYFGGSNYAAYDAAGYVRALSYGVDSNAPAAIPAGATIGINDITKNIKITGAITDQTSASVNTLNISGNYGFTMAAAQTFTANGILKGGASSATISGGTGIRADNNSELVIRTDAAGDSLTISTPVLANGANALTKSGAGTLTLSGANTYTGDTKVDAGTLALGNNLALQNSTLDTSGDGVISATGFTAPTIGGLKGSASLSSVISTGYGSITALTLNPGTGITDTYSGVIANGASGMTLTKSGLGTQAFTGANTYTGSTTVNSGILKISADSGLGSAPGSATAGHLTFGGGTLQTTTSMALSANRGVALTGSGTLSTDTDTTLTYSGIITGGAGASLTKAGAGTLVLNGANTYTGGTNLSSGTLSFISGSLSSSGTVDFTGNSTLQWGNGNTQDVSGRIKIDDGVKATMDTQANSLNFASAFQVGALKTGALAKTGIGTLTISVTNIYSGGTTVSAGVLKIGDKGALGTGAVSVAKNATLYLGTTKLNIGSGNYTQAAGATLSVGVIGKSSGSLSTSGTCTVGSTDDLVLEIEDFIPNNTSYTIIDGATGGSILAPDITTPGYDNALFSATTVGDDLVLTATRGAENGFAADAEGDSNAAAAGEVLDDMADPSDDMQNVLNTLDGLSNSEVDSSLDTMIPEVDAGVINTSTTALNNFVGVAIDRVEEVLTIAKIADSASTGMSAGDEEKVNGMWGKGYGSYLTQGTRNGIAGYDAWNAGTAVGIDRLFLDCVTLGASGGYAYGNVDGDVNNASTDISSAQTTVYGGYADKELPVFVDLAGSFAYNWYNGRRDINIGGVILRTANASYVGQQYGAYVGGGYKFNLTKNVEFTPLISLQYNHLQLGSYTETEAGALNLSVASQGYDQLQSGLGARIASPVKCKWGTFTPEAHGKWFYDFIGDAMTATSNFNGGGGDFSSNGCKPALNSFNAGGQMIFEFKNNVSVIGNCDTEMKDRFFGIYGSLTLRYDF